MYNFGSFRWNGLYEQKKMKQNFVYMDRHQTFLLTQNRYVTKIIICLLGKQLCVFIIRKVVVHFFHNAAIFCNPQHKLEQCDDSFLKANMRKLKSIKCGGNHGNRTCLLKCR